MTTERDQPLWRPDPARAATSAMAAFFSGVAARVPGAPRADAPYADWHAWSVREPELFWQGIWSACHVIGHAGERALLGGRRMAPPGEPGSARWFPEARLNFAENLLRRRDGAPALIARDESGARRELSFADLADAVRRAAGALRAAGVRPGDRVAGFLPNIPETVVSALAAASVGALWSSCSPDFGVRGVLDRFGQIAPKVLVVADGYRYAGKRIELDDRVREIVAGLPSVELLVTVPVLGLHDVDHRGPGAHATRRVHGDHTAKGTRDSRGGPTEKSWEAFLDAGRDAPLTFERLPFDHPLYVMYSSGTTGLPKCMVHGAGGTLLQHLKEHRLHVDLAAGERIFYFTTCGWMMWNWLLTALASDATLVLYDGSPLPEQRPGILWDLAAEERVAVFGTSAKYLAMSEKEGLAPARTHDLSSLRSILSTGSPLAEHSYDYVDRDVRPGVHLASISGGTDIVSCFALGNPMLPVWRGELQCRGLGMAVEVWDAAGKPVRGEAGELVCTRPFPSMPVAFWDDGDGSKYRSAYFDFYEGAWRHGDWAVITAHDGLVIHGRSDATLNPGGVRIGTAEIYRVVDHLPEILESVVIGQEVDSAGRPIVPGATGAGDRDVRIVLFVRMRPGLMLDDALRDRIRKVVRQETSPHHVPKVIEAVADIPRTVSGKISEIAVREVVHGRPVRNTEALANPEALRLYAALPLGGA